MHKEIHSFGTFSVSRTAGGDYVAERDDGTEVVLISPSGSDEHQQEVEWIEAPIRTEDDFLSAYQAIQMTIAQKVAALFENDGTTWETPQGETMAEVCERFGGAFSSDGEDWTTVFEDDSSLSGNANGWDIDDT